MLEGRLPGPAADQEEAALLPDVFEAGDAADVHQVAGGAEPELEERQEALAAGEDLGVAALGAVAREERERLLQGLGCVVVERCWDHRSISSFPRAWEG